MRPGARSCGRPRGSPSLLQFGGRLADGEAGAPRADSAWGCDPEQGHAADPKALPVCCSSEAALRTGKQGPRARIARGDATRSKVTRPTPRLSQFAPVRRPPCGRGSRAPRADSAWGCDPEQGHAADPKALPVCCSSEAALRTGKQGPRARIARGDATRSKVTRPTPRLSQFAAVRRPPCGRGNRGPARG